MASRGDRLVAALAGATCTRCRPRSDRRRRPQPPTVVVVSFDALGDRFLDRDTLPNFRRMMAEGVRAPFRPEFPSKTFPNHYSMATGLTPGQHGIVDQLVLRSRSQGHLSPHVGERRQLVRRRTDLGDGGARRHSRPRAYFWTGSEAEIRRRPPDLLAPVRRDVARFASRSARSCAGSACRRRSVPISS